MKSYEVKFGVDMWEKGVYERFIKHVLFFEKLGFDSIWVAEAHETRSPDQADSRSCKDEGCETGNRCSGSGIAIPNYSSQDADFS